MSILVNFNVLFVRVPAIVGLRVAFSCTWPLQTTVQRSLLGVSGKRPSSSFRYLLMNIWNSLRYGLWNLPAACPKKEKKMHSSLSFHRRFCSAHHIAWVWSHNGSASQPSHSCFLLLINDQDEQAMYLYTLQNESFIVAIVNTRKRVDGCDATDEALPDWEITRAQKCEWVSSVLEEGKDSEGKLLPMFYFHVWFMLQQCFVSEA